VSLRTKLSVSVLAQRKIESPRPRKHGLFLRAEEKMRLYGRTLISTQPWPDREHIHQIVTAFDEIGA
jgi:hypothetical protein